MLVKVHLNPSDMSTVTFLVYCDISISILVSYPSMVFLSYFINFLTSLSTRYTLLLLESEMVSIKQFSPVCDCKMEKNYGEGGESTHCIRLRRKEVKSSV